MYPLHTRVPFPLARNQAKSKYARSTFINIAGA